MTFTPTDMLHPFPTNVWPLPVTPEGIDAEAKEIH